ncbi:helix-turn-helix domain-containing protein [Cupriavidus sp. SK-4]|uniref:helix-turn-helix domain-containing protein n=1 Tax=Cupriavidus sp. SK-4 TaxID=574750 RepID=UPI001F239427|nr:helix-turn-helix domain-containing protein [Cupriavidus sp. SK-4]
MRPDTITMTMRQLDRLKVLQALADGHLKTGIAAARLGLSPRQTLRVLRRYQDEGAPGLQNRRQGAPGHRQLPPGLESRVRGLIRDSYADFGPTLAEKLLARLIFGATPRPTHSSFSPTVPQCKQVVSASQTVDSQS